MATKPAKKAGACARLFWGIGHLVVIIVFLAIDSELSEAFSGDVTVGSIFYLIFFFLLVVANAYLYLNLWGSNPGFITEFATPDIEAAIEEKRKQIRASAAPLEEFVADNGESSMPDASIATADAGGEDGAPVLEIRRDIEEETVGGELELPSKQPKRKTGYVTLEDTESTSSDFSEYEDGIPRICRHCNAIQDLRTKHCHDCGKCVRRFDHHCFWIATCVGVLNHRSFLMFTGTQTAEAIWALHICDTAFRGADTLDQWFSKNIGVLFLFLFLLAWVCLCGGLFAFHAYLALTNQTTWENLSRARITYLRRLPESFLPFNRGMWLNFAEFCFSMDLTTQWEREPVPPPGQEIPGTIFDNKYYSCC